MTPLVEMLGRVVLAFLGGSGPWCSSPFARHDVSRCSTGPSSFDGSSTSGRGRSGLGAAAGALTGATVVLQAGVYANQFGARLYTGWAAGYGLLWEFGPLVLGLLMSARIGARNAAELALLTIDGQIEGLKGVSLDPHRILVAPRVIAAILSIVALSMVTFLVAVGFETVAAYLMLGLPARVFLESFTDMLRLSDVAAGLLKSLGFALAIALVSTTAGLRVRGGAQGVGRAAANAVFASCATIFALTSS